ncbi:MAG: hypothetical protein ISS82_03255 [Nanoarchaeota archaeon]|nr:hypothetical protein [Nanoarchaeota archaeon]
MVKTYEEEQGLISEKEFKTLANILFKYISNEYRQFKWKFSSSITKSCYVGYIDTGYIDTDDRKFDDRELEQIMVGFGYDYISSSNILSCSISSVKRRYPSSDTKVVSQNFPVEKGMKPTGLGSSPKICLNG